MINKIKIKVKKCDQLFLNLKHKNTKEYKKIFCKIHFKIKTENYINLRDLF